MWNFVLVLVKASPPIVRSASTMLVTSPGSVEAPVSLKMAVSEAPGPAALLQLPPVAQLLPPAPVQVSNPVTGPWRSHRPAWIAVAGL